MGYTEHDDTPLSPAEEDLSTGYVEADDAPLILTKEQVKAMEARREALRDVYGTSNVESFEEGEAMVMAARKQVDEALQMLEDGLGDAYNEVMEKAPHLVEIESNPIRYLRASNYDPWAAANNIALYWKFRKEFFGERAFLPMVASGKGALSKEDVKAMKCGGTSILPPESNNRYVYFSDRARYCSLCGSQEVRARTAFYLLQSALDNDDVVRCGMVIAAVIDTNEKKKGDQDHNNPGVKMLKLFKTGAMPICFRALHVFVLRKQSFMETTIPLWLHVIERWKFISMRTVVHYSDSKEAALSDMKQYGFLEEHTPTQLGGKYDQDVEFDKWLQRRLKIEQKRYGTFSTRTPSNEVPQDSQGSHPMEASPQALEDLATAAEMARLDEAKARKRKLDAVYQRNKRENERNTIMRLKDQMNGLQKENDSLRAEHDSLNLSMEHALEALKDHAKAQEKATQAAVIPAVRFEGAPLQLACSALHPPAQQPGSGISISAGDVAQHVSQSSSDEGFFSNMSRSFLGFGAPAAARLPHTISNLTNQLNVDLALLRILQASGTQPGHSQLAQQLQVQQLLLQQQNFADQTELACVMLGANSDRWHGNVNRLPALPNPAAVTYNTLRQQHRQMPKTEKDILEAIWWKQHESL